MSANKDMKKAGKVSSEVVSISRRVKLNTVLNILKCFVRKF